MFGHFGIGQRFGAAADEIAIKFDARQRRRFAASRDQNVLGFQLRRTLLVINNDPPRTLNASKTCISRNFVLLEERIDAASQCGDHLVLALEHGGEINFDISDSNTMRREFVLGLRKSLARFEQRLTRNTADAEACAAERRLLFDASDVQAELRGADGGGVPTGSCADND